jgi:hypothetical protein
VWLDDVHHQHFSTFLGSLRATYGLEGAGEIKGKKLLRTKCGRAAVCSLLKALHHQRVPLLLYAVHKAYVAATVIVEDCTDYTYNNSFTKIWDEDTSLKNPLAGKIFTNTAPLLLREAWKAREGSDEARYRETYESILLPLTRHEDESLSDLAQRMRNTDLAERWSTLKDPDVDGSGAGGGFAPN